MTILIIVAVGLVFTGLFTLVIRRRHLAPAPSTMLAAPVTGDEPAAPANNRIPVTAMAMVVRHHEPGGPAKHRRNKTCARRARAKLGLSGCR